MAFMGRGDAPSSIGSSNDSNDNSNNDSGGLHQYINVYPVYKIDAMYALIQIIVCVILFVILFITYMVVYKSDAIDMIKDTKDLFFNTYILISAVVIIATVALAIKVKEETKLIKKIIGCLFISFFVLITFWFVRLSLDKTYTIDKFEQIYNEKYYDEKDAATEKIDLNNIDLKKIKDYKSKYKIHIGKNGLNITSVKEYTIEENDRMYGIFKMRMNSLFIIHFLINIVMIVQIIKLEKIKTAKEKIEKNDVVVYDETEDIKF